MSDQGRYVCKASNEAGQSEAVAEVIVNGKNIVIYKIMKTRTIMD